MLQRTTTDPPFLTYGVPPRDFAALVRLLTLLVDCAKPFQGTTHTSVSLARRAQEWGLPRGLPWLHADPREALEALTTHDLWPFSLDPADAPRWLHRQRLYVCTTCHGTGRRRAASYAAGRWAPCTCDGGWAFTTSSHDAPPSHVDLVGVAALGVERLGAVIGAAGMLRDALGAQNAPLLLCAMTAWELRAHHVDAGVRCAGQTLAGAFSAEETVCGNGRSTSGAPFPWPEKAPRGHAPRVRRAWPALRLLAGARAHLLDANPAGITVAAEITGRDAR